MLNALLYSCDLRKVTHSKIQEGNILDLLGVNIHEDFVLQFFPIFIKYILTM